MESQAIVPKSANRPQSNWSLGTVAILMTRLLKSFAFVYSAAGDVVPTVEVVLVFARALSLWGVVSVV